MMIIIETACYVTEESAIRQALLKLITSLRILSNSQGSDFISPIQLVEVEK